MNTIHDLRGTLAAHAEIHDVEIGTRSSAIARRVRVVRRRRAAGVGAAAALVAVAAAGVVLPHNGDGPPVATRLLGVDVPATMTADGFTYDYASSATADAGRAATATVDSGSGPVLVSWATGGADQSVEVSTPYTGFTSTMDDFTDYVVVPEGTSPTKVRVTGAGSTALAVYHLDANPPAGVSGDGATFREDVADRQLLAARIGSAGANRIDLDVTIPAGVSRVAFAELCSAPGEGERAWFRLSVDSDARHWVGRSCGSGWERDPGASVDGDPGRAVQAGQVLHLTVRLGRAHGSSLISDPDARIGLGVYALTTPDRTFPGGLTLPTVTEADGHTWRLVQATTGMTHGTSPWSATAPASSERLLVRYAVNGGSGAATVQPMIDGQDTDGELKVGRGVGPIWNSSAGTVDAGHHTFSMRVRGSGEARTAVGFYELAD